MVEKGKITNVTKEEFWVTFLASAFRSIRFGIKEAHGLGQVFLNVSQHSSKSKFLWAIPSQLCQLNYLLAKGGAFCDPETGLFGVNFDKMQQAVSDLTHDILVLQGNGDKKAVAEFVDKYGKLGREIEQALDRIEHSGKLLLLLNWS